MNNEGKDMEGSVCGLISGPKVTDKHHEKHQSVQPVSRLRLVPGTSRILSRSANHWPRCSVVAVERYLNKDYTMYGGFGQNFSLFYKSSLFNLLRSPIII
jgi:hypothetical protein